MNAQNRGRAKLVFVFLLFFVPLWAAYILYFSMPGLLSGTTNKGELLSPVQPLPEVSLKGENGAIKSLDVWRDQWTFLQVAPDGCDDTCMETLAETRQIWALLHDDRGRVQRVLLVGPGKLSELPEFSKQPFLEVYGGELDALRAMMSAQNAAEAGTVYLIDPHGNWVLYYPPEGDGAGLFDDIKHLMKLSYIG